MSDRSHEVTELLAAYAAGDEDALRRLVPLIYDDLRIIARRHLAREREGHTLNTTALVHEAYLNLAAGEGSWRDRAHFFAAASRAMRHILVDYARRRRAVKRGGEPLRVPLRPDMTAEAPRTLDLLALDEALTALERKDERLGRVVECRFFGGMKAEETAEALGVSLRTVERDWSRAKAYLHRTLSPSSGSNGRDVGGGAVEASPE